jgi:hypothetical protein
MTLAVVLGGIVSFALLNGSIAISSDHSWLSPEARLVAIRRAQVWTATDVGSMDMKAGPQGPGALTPGETVTCEYVERKMSGRSPKFTCALTPDDEVKVKYRRENGEVYGEVAASRLLWALGFGADRMYPVRVVCRGCPADPDASLKNPQEEVTFDPAAIEREREGVKLETHEDSGWSWLELDLVEETVGGAPRAHRDALKLLAVMIQHTDSKPAQQRLMCAPGQEVGKDGEPCLQTFMMISDLGLTFGQANLLNRGPVGSVNLEQWSRAPVWADPKRCIGSVPQSQTGTLNRPRISEAGRSFLAGLLVQLTDAQLHDLFEVSRFAERTGPSVRAATIDEWMEVFKRKRDEIVNHSCAA